ncbi:uncharacterized protein LOC126833868 [Adelges cooleyi]|uniref:uncharacterized protein LOC126833868 n=1 Tax=Adelges cooleyi TaxID=133065 RepID=UPI00217FB7DA|nr:uncharacterized protein LOC126833868 [Adelges cooleyi]
MEAFRHAVERVMGKPADQLDCALMASVQRQLMEVADAINGIRPLAELTDVEKRECSKTSSVKRYPAECVVYDEDRDFSLVPGDAYFLLEGQCLGVQRLRVRKRLVAGHDRYALVQDVGERDGPQCQTVYVKTSELRPGSVFCIGERSEGGRLVLSITEVKYLLVPFAFLAKHNTANVWGRTACSLDSSALTVRESFRKFVVSKKWEEYKKSTVEAVVLKWKTEK